jgi:hypothetical protein
MQVECEILHVHAADEAADARPIRAGVLKTPPAMLDIKESYLRSRQIYYKDFPFQRLEKAIDGDGETVLLS